MNCFTDSIFNCLLYNNKDPLLCEICKTNYELND